MWFDFGSKIGCRWLCEMFACRNLPPTRKVPVSSRNGLSESNRLFKWRGFPFSRSRISWPKFEDWTSLMIRWLVCRISWTVGMPLNWLSVFIRKQYDRMRRNLLIEEYRFRISFSSMTTVKNESFRNSSSRVGTWISKVGQVVSSSLSQDGPVLQRSFLRDSSGDCPRDIESAGFSWDRTCFQSLGFVDCRISAIRLATKVLSLWGDVLIQCRTIVESVQNTVRSSGTFMAFITALYRVVNNVAAHSSRRGIVCTFFIGATLDFEQTSCI